MPKNERDMKEINKLRDPEGEALLGAGEEEASRESQNPSVGDESAVEESAAESPEPRARADWRAEERVASLEKEKAELFDRLLRKHAELENYRKRVEKEKEESYQQGVIGVVREILPVVDACERALSSFKAAGSADNPVVENYRSGVELLYKQFQDALRKAGVVPIEALGATFDPHLHEAVARVEAAGPQVENQVIEEMQKGYLYRDRLLRPAQVKVATKSTPTVEHKT